MRSFFGRMVYRLAENSNISIGELLFWVSLILILVFIVWGAIVAENMMRRKRAEIEALVDATTAASSKFHEAMRESCKSFFELNNYSMESLRKVPAENGIFLYAFVYGIMFGNIAFLLMYRNINDIKTIEEKVSSYDVQEQSTLSTNGFFTLMGFSNIVILALQTRVFGAFYNDSESELEQQSDKESRLSLKIISLFNTGSNLVRDHSNVINVIFDPNFDPNRVLELTEKVRTEMGVIMNSLMRVPLEL